MIVRACSTTTAQARALAAAQQIRVLGQDLLRGASQDVRGATPHHFIEARRAQPGKAPLSSDAPWMASRAAELLALFDDATAAGLPVRSRETASRTPRSSTHSTRMR